MNLKQMFLARTVMLCAITPAVLCQEEDPSPRRQEDKFSPAAEAEWKRRFEAIEKEIAALTDHPWAGTYYHGNGLSANARLTLAPMNGFVFIRTGCLGVYDRNYGEVVPTKHGSLRLVFRFENNRDGFRGVAPELIPVPWGERQYLVRADDVVGFCNAINSGHEPRDDRHGLHFLRPGDGKKPATGAPGLPERYRTYLLAEPIDAEIIAVHETEVEIRKGDFVQYATTVTVNVGRADKVLPGMSFNVYKPYTYWHEVHVVSVDDHTSKARVRHCGNTPIPEIGWKLTTGSRCSKLGTKMETKGQHDEDQSAEP